MVLLTTPPVKGRLDAEVLGVVELLHGGGLSQEGLREALTDGIDHRGSQSQQDVPPVHAGHEAVLEQRHSVRHREGTSCNNSYCLVLTVLNNNLIF